MDFTCRVSVVVSLMSAVHFTAALSPSFHTFVSRSTGRWEGAASRWSRVPAAFGEEGLQVSGFAGLESFSLSAAAMKTEREVQEVMRSCGGAIQGVKETRSGVNDDGLYLNRADDNFCYFDDGSWVHFSAGFLLEASLQHGSSTRRRFCVRLDPTGALLSAEVALEVKVDGATTQGKVDGPVDGRVEAQIADLLEGDQLELALEAEVWPSGAFEHSIVGRRHSPGAPWVAARAKWSATQASLRGGAALLADLGTGDALLPAMAFVRRLAPAGSLEVVSLLAGERKVLRRRAAGGGASMQDELGLLAATPVDSSDAEQGWDWDDDEHELSHDHGD